MERFMIRGREIILPRCGGTSTRWPEGQLLPRAGSMSLSQSAITQLGWDFHTLRGGIDAEDLSFRPRVVGVVGLWKDF